MRYDDAVCRFEMWHDLEDMDEPRRFVARIVELLPAAAFALPVNMEPTDAGLTAWLARRTLPKNRANIISFLAKMHLDERDKVGILDVSFGLSLNDAFWIWNEENGAPLRFDDINLYDNDFSDIVALMAFTGEGSVSDSRSLGSSPEYTTGGMLAKAWRRIEGRICLYKTGTEGFVNAGFEPYSEHLASQVAERMGLRAVEYRFEMWKNRLCSVCELFTSKDIAFVNAGSLVRSGGMRAVLAYYRTLGESYYQQLVSMLAFDGVIANQDRHFGNFGLLVGRDNSFVDTAPLFDQGISLFVYAHGEDWDDLDRYLLDHRPATYESYIDFVKPCLGDEQRRQIERLSGFTFERHPIHNLSEWRYEKLEAFIANQAEKLLSA
ncbi:MAG: hypothetical protein LBL86_06220 [Coriobacteriales bacterium]|nr:hypothetical protein [Coriobacteriales bacterium]